MTRVGLCVYCGLPTPRGPTCVAHTDLPRLDPSYSLATVLAMVQYPALVLEDRAPAPKGGK